MRLLTVNLFRSYTAREAVKMMGDMACEYGFYAESNVSLAGETILVSDKLESWVFHILADPSGRSALWAAQRVPDEHISVVANMFVIREIYTHNKDEFMYSENIFKTAIDLGWWSGEGLMDFTATFSVG